MQVNQPQGGAAEATTPAVDLRLVSVEQLKMIHRDLDACQKVIWLAGVRPHGYGFDPAYCTDAQARLTEIEGLIAGAPSSAHDVVTLVETLVEVTSCLTAALTGREVPAGTAGRALIKAGLVLEKHLLKQGGEA